MLARLGNVLYWTGSGIAILLASLGAIGFVITLINGGGDGMIAGPMLIVAAIPIWLAGRACLYVLAGR